MFQTFIRQLASIPPLELAAIAILSALLLLLLATRYRGLRASKPAGLLLAALCAAALIGLLAPEGGGPAKPEAGALGGTDDLYASDGKRFLHRNRLFGPDVARARLDDARLVYADFLGQAIVAELATFPEGGGVLAARFGNAAEAAEAARGYLRRFRVEMSSGDLTQGLQGQRGDLSDRVEMLLDGNMLVVWVARTDVALAARRWASEAGRGATRQEGNK